MDYNQWFCLCIHRNGVSLKNFTRWAYRWQRPLLHSAFLANQYFSSRNTALNANTWPSWVRWSNEAWQLCFLFSRKSLREYAHSFTSYSELLPMVGFTINSAVHALKMHTTSNVSEPRHPRICTLIECGHSLGKLSLKQTIFLALSRRVSTPMETRIMPM